MDAYGTPEWEMNEELCGRLAKVVAVEDDGYEIFFRMKDDIRITRASASNPMTLSKGDVILVGNNIIKLVHSHLWNEELPIGIIRKLWDDKVLLETSLGLKTIQIVGAEGLKIGNTVGFSEEDGTIEVLSESPIRVRDEDVDDDDIAKLYCIPWTDEGPTFADFGGYPAVVTRAKELIETQLDRMEEMRAIKARPVRGVLFSGPPGTGKTHLARIIAREAKADLFLVSGPSIVSKWVGDSEQALRRIFETAAEKERAIIFFDEIDSIAERRSGNTHESSKRLVAQLLTLMDGFAQSPKGTIVIAATNRAHDIDEALLRPGRFDWEIEFGLPSEEDRNGILRIGAAHHQTEEGLPLTEIAKLTEGWSAATLASLWTEAALIAAGDKRRMVAGEDVAMAFERISFRQSKLTVVNPQ